MNRKIDYWLTYFDVTVVRVVSKKIERNVEVMVLCVLETGNVKGKKTKSMLLFFFFFAKF